MITENLTLTPAYGRDYPSRDKVTADFLAGKDFAVATPGYHTYCTVGDFRAGVMVSLRYNKLRSQTLCRVP